MLATQMKPEGSDLPTTLLGRKSTTNPTLSLSRRASPGRRNSTGLEETRERREDLKTTAHPSGLLPVRFLYSHW